MRPRSAVKHLSEGASLINIGSVGSRITPPNSAVYTGTKRAVDAITGVLARELGPKKIRVNTINPAWSFDGQKRSWKNQKVFLTVSLAGWEVGLQRTEKGQLEIWFGRLLPGHLDPQEVDFLRSQEAS